MADSDKDSKKNQKVKPVKKQQTVRERTQSSSGARTKRVRQTAGKVGSGIKNVSSKGKREFHLPLPDNKAGRILKKRVRLVPKFIKEAWQELRLVTWPNANDTIRLTMAVFIFSVVFAAIVGILDYGLDKLFKEVIIKR